MLRKSYTMLCYNSIIYIIYTSYDLYKNVYLLFPFENTKELQIAENTDHYEWWRDLVIKIADTGATTPLWRMKYLKTRFLSQFI